MLNRAFLVHFCKVSVAKLWLVWANSVSKWTQYNLKNDILLFAYCLWKESIGKNFIE